MDTNSDHLGLKQDFWKNTQQWFLKNQSFVFKLYCSYKVKVKLFKTSWLKCPLLASLDIDFTTMVLDTMAGESDLKLSQNIVSGQIDQLYSK